MKAQAAMLEVLLSFVVLASLSSLAVNLLYASPTIQRSYDFNIGNALYDFGNMLYHNDSVRNCFIATDRKCELGIAKNLSVAFSLKYVRLSNAGDTAESGSEMYCSDFGERCYLIPKTSTYYALCLYVCD